MIMNNQQRAENAILWIDTLLKTRMKQGTEQLGDSRGYCCLGVACKKLSVPFNPEDTSSPYLIEILGLHTLDGHAKHPKTKEVLAPAPNLSVACLTDLNDNQDYTFRDIAKHLLEATDFYFRPGVAKLIKKHYR